MVKQIFIFIGLLIHLTSRAQTDGNIPSPVDAKAINIEARSKISQFKNFLVKLATTRNKADKNILKKSLKSLFEDDASMEVMTKRGKGTYSMSKYLNDVVPAYTDRFAIVLFTVKIVSINSQKLTPIKNSNGEIIKYRGTFRYIQGFCVKVEKPENPEGFDYSDPNKFDVCEETEKTGEFFLEKEYQRILGNVWVLKLGDIKAEHYYDKKAK